ncbi:hypothetical protein DPMN_037674 [Dreissena polymorpha]|uniref:Uncharacterized protein n=1 Tax=Dreissena polymorpha TaxID=45954 RepID=A0A9D4MBS3_DREPO|nr:hypothetical protein DPMN_037674 [Dreissena polymorpha]
MTSTTVMATMTNAKTMTNMTITNVCDVHKYVLCDDSDIYHRKYNLCDVYDGYM